MNIFHFVLGGGSGSIVFPEFVTIQLTQSGGSDSALIGATVVVTNDDTSATILSTTWNGSGIAAQVDAGVNYTVTVGNVSSLAIRQNTQSYTAESGLSRIIGFHYVGNVVNLGLPSGILWARTNIDASRPNGFAASEFQYNFSFFSFGNIVGHNPISTTAFDYSFDQTNYNSTPGSQLTGNVPVSASYDAARAICGEPYRLPTKEEFQELLDNCNFVDGNGNIISGSNKLVTINSVVGICLKSKINSETIFFSCTGWATGNNRNSYASNLNYQSSTIAANTNLSWYLNGYNVSIYLNSVDRFYGFAGRAVV